MKPRLIKSKFTPAGVCCANCKYSIAVDAKHNRFYCVKPEAKCWIYYGEHVCGQGVSK